MSAPASSTLDKKSTDSQKPVDLSPEAERARGRHPDYERLSPREQWEEDKRLGILDWDGS